MAEPVVIAERAEKMILEGADMIDVGAYSSRPGADDISPLEEMKRLEVATCSCEKCCTRCVCVSRHF